MSRGIAESVLDLIGHTPLLHLSRFVQPPLADVYAKIEWLNPGGSVKDRAALGMILDAEEKGLLKPGGTIIEPTAGNTGIGLALVGVARGYRVILCVPRGYAEEKMKLIEVLGGEIEYVPCEAGMTGAIERSLELAADIDSSFIPQQFENTANPCFHELTTGREIVEQMNGRIDAVVIGAGTSGTFCGVSRAVRKQNPNALCVLVDPEGSIYGFIGPNGSGKTTTIRMIMNIILPDRGDITVLGRRGTDAARDDVSYLPEERGLYKQMQVRRLLRYYGRLKGRTARDLDPVITRWLDTLGLATWADKRIDQLSKGMAQKVQFIASVVSQPKLLILDEPFSGLDPVNAESLRDAVLDLRRQGTTIVFSTHDMGAAEKLCDRIFMIFKGHKVLDGSLDAIQQQYGHDTVRVRLGGGAQALAGIGGVESVNDHGNFQDVRFAGDPQTLLRELVTRTAVLQFEITKPSLHDIFIRIARPTDDDLRAAGEVA